MAKYQVADARGREQTVEAKSFAEARDKIERDGRHNVYGVSRGRSIRFYLDRGEGGGLYPISAAAASVEAHMTSSN